MRIRFPGASVPRSRLVSLANYSRRLTHRSAASAHSIPGLAITLVWKPKFCPKSRTSLRKLTVCSLTEQPRRKFLLAAGISVLARAQQATFSTTVKVVNVLVTVRDTQKQLV